MSTSLTSPEDILTFWFGEPGSSPLARAKVWFEKDEAFDREVRERFEATLDAAARGGCDAWRSTPRGRLALVILFDQLSRNMFRGSPRSFAQDSAALALTREALDAGEDRSLAPLERYFLVMPLMHAEDAAAQARCVAELGRLRDEAPAELHATFDSAVDYAQRHAAIIERFGRFPHRNAILGRATTPEEAEFLKGPGSSF